MTISFGPLLFVPLLVQTLQSISQMGKMYRGKKNMNRDKWQKHMYAKQPLVVPSALQDAKLEWQGSMLQTAGKQNHWSECEIPCPSL